MCKAEFGVTREEDVRRVSDAIDLNVDGDISEEEFVVWALCMSS